MLKPSSPRRRSRTKLAKAPSSSAFTIEYWDLLTSRGIIVPRSISTPWETFSHYRFELPVKVLLSAVAWEVYHAPAVEYAEAVAQALVQEAADVRLQQKDKGRAI